MAWLLMAVEAAVRQAVVEQVPVVVELAAEQVRVAAGRRAVITLPERHLEVLGPVPALGQSPFVQVLQKLGRL
jgi:hypothetical protein